MRTERRLTEAQQAVVHFLLDAGDSSPKDVGVCALGHRNGAKAWGILNGLTKRGLVKRSGYATYKAAGLACRQLTIRGFDT